MLYAILFYACCACVSFASIEANSNLIRSVVRSLFHRHGKQVVFENIIYPIVREQPHIFRSIMHRLLVSPFHSPRVTTQDVDDYIAFIGKNNHTEDQWILYFWKHIDFITFGHSDSIFSIGMVRSFGRVSQGLSVVVHGEHQDIDWSMIPCFLHSPSIKYESNYFRTVDLSDIDPFSHLQSLFIRIRDGFITLPNHSFPKTLRTLSLSHYPSSGYLAGSMTDYEVLDKVAGHVDNLTIYENTDTSSFMTLSWY